MPTKRKPAQRKRIPVTLTYDPELWAQVKARAELNNQKYTAVVEDALRLYFAQRKETTP